MKGHGRVTIQKQQENWPIRYSLPIPENNTVNHLHSSVCLLFILYKPPNLNWSSNFSMVRTRGKIAVGTCNHFEKADPPFKSMVFHVRASPAIPNISKQVLSFLLSMAISSTYTSVPHSCSQPRSLLLQFFLLSDISLSLQFICV